MDSHQATFLLLDLAVIIVLARLFGLLARRVGQPPVVGEIVAGVLLGPSVLGATLSEWLFPLDSRPFLAALANVGVATFMFLVGLELDAGALRRRGRVAAGVAGGAFLVPFALGSGVAFVLAAGRPTAHLGGFVLFMGVAMAVTALPVLARIVEDRNLGRTFLGGVALSSAAVGDVLAWSLLAGVVAVVGLGEDQWLLLLAVPYLVVMLGVVRPLLRRLVSGREVTLGLLVTLMAGQLLSGAATEWLGLHFIFGSFLLGVLVPRGSDGKAGEAVLARVGELNTILLLPVFFVVAGLEVDLSLIGVPGLGELALIVVVAVVGKGLGAFLGARCTGVDPHGSAVLAALMNTRGLTELIILTIGLQLGLLDAELYSMMVVMAVLTTAMTGPLLHLLGAGRPRRSPPARPRRRSELSPAADRVDPSR
ncbi:cation:proton antiporter domain-containing protein [Actinophytocola xanthii]|uniref:Cation/H(+) antiporter n=1 Tax=Actinophytocola xanthii TaxID=1912961 RepID=A0A1Q8CM82_9PSEU|nr:cation:proton antiporter [Actinophytocola xanthii]OLF15464.1 cation/H(+) antiporter [Actinophytocola xanthii]